MRCVCSTLARISSGTRRFSHDLYVSLPAGVSSHAAQPPALTRWREGTSILARNGDRAHAREPHARNGRSRATRRAAAASGAGRDVHTCPADLIGREPSTILADSTRARPSRSSPDPASTAGTRRAASS